MARPSASAVPATPRGAPTALSDVYFYSKDNWGLDGLVAKGTLRLKGGSGSTREIFFATGDFTQTGPLPEPGSWETMITGFALVGGAMRRRRHAPA